MVSMAKTNIIKDAIKIHGTQELKFKRNLPEDITYGEIRMVMAAEKMKNSY